MIAKKLLTLNSIKVIKSILKIRYAFSIQNIDGGNINIKKQQNESKVSQIPSLKAFIQQQQKSVLKSKQQLQNASLQKIENQIFRKSFQSLNSHLQSQQSMQFSALKYHIQTYGCQMNVNDSQIVRSILKSSSLNLIAQQTPTAQQANIVFLNTCAIRQSAQSKIHTRIKQLKGLSNIKILGVLGCMAERLKDGMFREGVNIVCGPDAYRDLPNLIKTSLNNGNEYQKNQMNVQLSVEETYADITPVRKNQSAVGAFLSIMRGCNNMCSFCIVPFVRGRERSRDVDTILKQIEQLQSEGVKQITLLGQNVNSYHDTSKLQAAASHKNAQGFSETFKLRNIPGYRFAQLLQTCGKSFPDIRFRFTSPHPKDFPDEVIQTIAKYQNICNYIHLPAQSGNTEMLFKMRRNHTRQAYVNLANKMRQIIPNLTLSTDLICGFCGETDQQFQDTLSLIEQIKYENAFLFAYSMREKTHAHRNYQDDVPLEVKKYRLKTMMDLFQKIQRTTNDKELNTNHLILIQNTTKRDSQKWIGKTDNFKKAVIPKGAVPFLRNGQFLQKRQVKMGDFVAVRVQAAGARTLQCQPIAIIQNLSDYKNFSSKILDFTQKSCQLIV